MMDHPFSISSSSSTTISSVNHHHRCIIKDFMLQAAGCLHLIVVSHGHKHNYNNLLR
jgi:hypothetical protein